MDEPKDWTVGEACPACGSEMHKAPVISAEQERRLYDKEISEPVPRHFDNAPATTRAKLGVLYRCGRCRYASRVLPQGKKAKGEAA